MMMIMMITMMTTMMMITMMNMMMIMIRKLKKSWQIRNPIMKLAVAELSLRLMLYVTKSL